jgi:GntR family transcriptional regulator/MocR family aminotransferase
MWNQLIQLTFKSQISLQAQIREMLVAAILDGHVPVGVPLPSTRVLAQQLGVARNTVALAYELLVNEGYLRTKSRSGHFVNAEILAGRAAPRPRPAALPDAPPAAAWETRMRFSVSRQRNIVKPKDWQKYPYPFIYGQFDPAQIPVAGWRECSMQALSTVEVRGWAGDLIDGDDTPLVEQDPDAASRPARRLGSPGRDPGHCRRAACAVSARDAPGRHRDDRRRRGSGLSRCAQHLRFAHAQRRCAAARR